MTEQEMWEAVKENNADYDGIFFYAVKSTGIYCRPSCKSKLPRKENICFFDRASQAKEAGFRPCKRCRSDLLEYQPMKTIARNVKQKIEEAFVSQSEIYESLREAKRLLADTKDKVIDIAYATGFSSLSTFNRFFKQKTNVTPTQYRRTKS